MLRNRHEAGILLAQKLQRYKNTNAIVLAISRGGVVVGRHSLSDDGRKDMAVRVINDIAEGFISRDKKYLVGNEGVGGWGRPVSPDSRRDQWSSFIIDFGVLNKGDGFFTWNGTPDVFKKLWDEVTGVIREKHQEEYTNIANVYIKMHPDLSQEDVGKILAT